MPDEPKDRGAEIGRTADISGVAPEKLLQPWVGKLQPQGLRERQTRRHGRDQRGRFHHMGGQGGQLWRGLLHDGGIEGLVEPSGLVGEAPELRLRLAPGEVAHSHGAQVGVSMEVQHAPIPPPVPREDRVGMECDVILKTLSDLGKQILEYVPHRHDGGADIDRPGNRLPRTHLAAGAVGHVHDLYRQPAMGQPERG
jgi:hypothetical protein